ncbi:unnamed protein product, partial [marine sediment metagenome]
EAEIRYSSNNGGAWTTVARSHKIARAGTNAGYGRSIPFTCDTGWLGPFASITTNFIVEARFYGTSIAVDYRDMVQSVEMVAT